MAAPKMYIMSHACVRPHHHTSVMTAYYKYYPDFVVVVTPFFPCFKKQAKIMHVFTIASGSDCCCE